MSNIKKLMMSAATGGAGLDVAEVFSTYLYTGDYNTGTLNQHIKSNVPLSNFGTGGSSVNFDGGDYLTRGDFSGNSDGKELTFSAWILFNDFENNFVFSSDPSGSGSGVNVGYHTGKLRFEAYNSAGSVVSQWHVDDSKTPFHQWFHLCFSVNTASGVGATKVYINDVAATTESVSSSNQDIDRTRTVQSIAVRGTDYKLTGNLAHVFMDYTYRDLSVEANRRLFIDANGGSTDPSTLSALNPIMYCPLTDDYTMGENLGTGGDFTSSGNPAFSTLGTEATADTSEGGMVWIKNRDQADDHMLFDTERGAPKPLSSNSAAEEVTNNPDTLTQFLADGFFLGDDAAVNTNNENYASWTFRKAPKFFDVVTYTGDGVAGREIAHNLGTTVGFIVVKRTDTTGNWRVWARRDASNAWAGFLNGTSAGASPPQAAIFGDGTSYIAPTSTEFTVSSTADLNESGGTYVAYLFAHNDGDGEFGPNGDADIIKCGSYTGNGSGTAGPEIDLGFEPQWILAKRTDSTGYWTLVDSMRGMIAGGDDKILYPNTSDAEQQSERFVPSATGFQVNSTNGYVNASGGSYIYIAIRRGPMAVPESATEVFAISDASGTDTPAYKSSFPIDMGFEKNSAGTNDWQIYSRLTQTKRLRTNDTSAESTVSTATFDFMNGYKDVSVNVPDYYAWMWKRAPKFFDVVAYTGDGTSGRTVSHNLGVAPEMMWVKNRSTSTNWAVYHKDADSSIPQNKYLYLNTSGAVADATVWNDTAPTDSQFTVGSFEFVNQNNTPLVAYLFASLDGISKVGSYTGNGATQTINCGFTSGARLVIIKNIDIQDGWYIFDTVRGITTTSNDGVLFLNYTQQQYTEAYQSGGDLIQPDNSGFKATGFINRNNEDYIFYAIA